MTELAQAEMQMLTQSVIQYLDEWRLSPSEIIKLLGIDGLVPLRQFQLYRKGEKALPQTPEVMARLEHLIGIADALRTTYPFSHQMRQIWLRQPHRRFEQQSPLDVIQAQGIEGMVQVRADIDCSYGFSGSR